MENIQGPGQGRFSVISCDFCKNNEKTALKAGKTRYIAV